MKHTGIYYDGGGNEIEAGDFTVEDTGKRLKITPHGIEGERPFWTNVPDVNEVISLRYLGDDKYGDGTHIVEKCDLGSKVIYMAYFWRAGKPTEITPERSLL